MLRMVGLPASRRSSARWRRLPGEVEQVFTHFALRLTVYAAEFEGGAPAGCFWVKPDAVGAAGFSSMMRKAVEHALTQRLTAAGRLLWKGQGVAANLAKTLRPDGARFAASKPVHAYGALDPAGGVPLAVR